MIDTLLKVVALFEDAQNAIFKQMASVKPPRYDFISEALALFRTRY